MQEASQNAKQRALKASCRAGRGIHVAIAGLLLLAAAMGWHWRNNYWKRFGIVESALIYRSGQLTSDQLKSAIRRLHLRTVIALNTEATEREKALCESMGVDYLSAPMPSDGRGDEKAFAEALQTLESQDRLPVLIHCQAGVARTGAVVALHRVLHQRWPMETALKELRSYERNGRLEPALREHIVEMARKLGPPARNIAAATAAREDQRR